MSYTWGAKSNTVIHFGCWMIFSMFRFQIILTPHPLQIYRYDNRVSFNRDFEIWPRRDQIQRIRKIRIRFPISATDTDIHPIANRWQCNWMEAKATLKLSWLKDLVSLIPYQCNIYYCGNPLARAIAVTDIDIGTAAVLQKHTNNIFIHYYWRVLDDDKYHAKVR